MKKIKGFKVVDNYPEDGWLRGYFYAREEDLKNHGQNRKKAYQDLGYIRHKDHILHLLNIKKDEKVLDVGCADGAMMIYCGLLGAEVFGIDLSHENVEKTNKYLVKYALKGKAVAGDAKLSNFQENFFDKTVSSDFFEHLSFDDTVVVLKEIKRVLKPGGILVLKTPNLRYLKLSRLYKMIMRAVRFKNPFDVVIPHTTGQDAQHIGLMTKNSMVKAINSAGFLNFTFSYDMNSKIERISYSWGEFFTKVPFLKDLICEDIIAVVYKPIILSFFE